MTSHARSLAWIPVLSALATSGLPGCSGEGDAIDHGAPSGHQPVGEFVLHVQPSRQSMTVYRVLPAEAAAHASRTLPAGPGLAPLSLVDANLCQDSTTGSNDPTKCGLPAGTQTVELVTDPASVKTNSGCPTGYKTGSFCADVTLNSFWSTTLNNTYAQVTAITDAAGAPLSGHNGWNIDTPPNTSALDSSLGLWQHQSASVDTTHFSNGTTGVILPGAANGGKRTWVFHDADGADFYIKLKVWASVAYANYTLGTGLHDFIDACGTGGTQVTLTNTGTGFALSQPEVSDNAATFQLPFAFTFYGTRYAAGSTLSVSKWGNLGFGTSATSRATVSDTNVTLASVNAPHPGVFIFWDHLRWAGTGARGLCARQYGVAPNRQLVFTWERIGFTGSDLTFMTFSAVLNESSEEIWFQYPTMGGNSYLGGATVGAQNDDGNIAANGSTSTQLTFASGTYRALLPLP